MTTTALIKRLFPQFPYSQDESRRILRRFFHRFTYHVEGIEHVPRQGPVLLVMNHTGWEEILLLILSTPRPIKFVGIAEELHLDEESSWSRLYETVHFEHVGPRARAILPYLGRHVGESVRLQLLEFGFIPTHVRSKVRGIHVGTNGIREILRNLEQQQMIVLFPEAGLNRRGCMLPFRPGIGLLIRQAERMGIPLQILPCAQHSAGCLAWSLRNVYEPRLVYGKPLRLATAGRTAAQFDGWVTSFLQDQVYSLMQRAWEGFDIPVQKYPGPSVAEPVTAENVELRDG